MELLFIAIYVVLILVVMEIAVTLFILTGLDPHIARFQVVSILTSTGFTTRESELILRHPVRRKIAVFLILFGVFSLAVLISTLSSVLKESLHIPGLLTVTGLFGIGLLAVRGGPVRRMLARRMERHLNEDFELHELPMSEVLFFNSKDQVRVVEIDASSEYIEKRYGELIREEEDLQILYVQRGHHKIRQGLLQTEVHEGDRIVVYGTKDCIRTRFQREMERMRRAESDEQNLAALE